MLHRHPAEIYFSFDSTQYFDFFLQSRWTKEFGDRKAPDGQHQMGKGELRKQLCDVHGQTLITRFTMME